ncbi:MAG: DegT/DnrJ/EryC1/StrS family aminotransferase [Planctomycetes bacterium]|nr:DegT/DnrJ/EryC1/StrS family aminotransferase [Planctomycetota bacterium]
MSSHPIALADPAADHASLASEIESAVLQVLRSGRYVLGPEHDAFEQELALKLGTPHGFAVSNGSDALLLPLMALDLEPGDEVITTPFTFFATGGAVHRVGAKPVFVDIDPETWNLDPARVAERIGARTRVVMPVHLYGKPAPLTALEALCTRHDLCLIEDAAQAILSQVDGRSCGTVGRFGGYSFFPSKNLGAAGEGGYIAVREADDAARIKALRTHGETQRYHHRYVGGNFRMHALQAAILRVKLRQLEGWNERRRQNAKRYLELLRGAGLDARVQLPRWECNEVWNVHQFTIEVDRRDEVQKKLAEKGIATGVYYPVPLHLQECFAYLGYKKGDLPHAERAAARVLSLPVGPHVSAADQERVVRELAAVLDHVRAGELV